MNFDAEKFLSDAGISFKTKGENVPRDAVNICCFYCGDSGKRYHLVINKHKPFSACWVCGKYVPTVELVKDILKCSWADARKIVYGDKHILFGYDDEIFDRPKRAKICRLPKYVRPVLENVSKYDTIRENAKQYLFFKRNISVQRVEQFNLCYGYGGEQAYRIVIPMYFGGQLMTYTGRDFTDRSGLRYKACETENCVLLPTEFLYGLDEFEGHKAIVVEGAFDRIVMGNGAMAASTNKLSPKQKSMLCNLDLEELVFVLDPDAFDKAEELAEYFRPVVNRVKAVQLVRDNPNSLKSLVRGDPAKLGSGVVRKRIRETKWFDF